MASKKEKPPRGVAWCKTMLFTFNCIFMVSDELNCVFMVSDELNCIFMVSDELNCIFMVSDELNCIFMVSDELECIFMVSDELDCIFTVSDGLDCFVIQCNQSPKTASSWWVKLLCYSVQSPKTVSSCRVKLLCPIKFLNAPNQWRQSRNCKMSWRFLCFDLSYPYKNYVFILSLQKCSFFYFICPKILSLYILSVQNKCI